MAAFDLDGTLSDGGSVFKWLRSVAGTRATYLAALSLALPLLTGALRSGPTADRAKERLFQRLLRGRDESEVRTLSRTFILDHLALHGRPAVIARLRWHQAQGHDVVIVSASPQLYVDVIAEHLDTAGLGTRLAVDARGALTGAFLGQNCRGSEKLRRLEEWLTRRYPAQVPTTYAYGNSRGDRRMLSAATHPVDVGRLGVFGALRSFPKLPAALSADE